ncbi:NnrS family protein [Bradyrhizobium tunisiense]|uniref:NnrS family protein n=1 Tax=Bradyrhizobium tunisiense TaxID=3278709 RepID=UPI0035DBEAE5
MSFAPRYWHVDEMLLGYVATIPGGFLLTAAPNWTGRLPLQGTLLMPGSTCLARSSIVVDRMTGRPAIDAAFLAFRRRQASCRTSGMERASKVFLSSDKRYRRRAERDRRFGRSSRACGAHRE